MSGNELEPETQPRSEVNRESTLSYIPDSADPPSERIHMPSAPLSLHEPMLQEAEQSLILYPLGSMNQRIATTPPLRVQEESSSSLKNSSQLSNNSPKEESLNPSLSYESFKLPASPKFPSLLSRIQLDRTSLSSTKLKRKRLSEIAEPVGEKRQRNTMNLDLEKKMSSPNLEELQTYHNPEIDLAPSPLNPSTALLASSSNLSLAGENLNQTPILNPTIFQTPLPTHLQTNQNSIIQRMNVKTNQSEGKSVTMNSRGIHAKNRPELAQTLPSDATADSFESTTETRQKSCRKLCIHTQLHPVSPPLNGSNSSKESPLASTSSSVLNTMSDLLKRLEGVSEIVKSSLTTASQLSQSKQRVIGTKPQVSMEKPYPSYSLPVPSNGKTTVDISADSLLQKTQPRMDASSSTKRPLDPGLEEQQSYYSQKEPSSLTSETLSSTQMGFGTASTTRRTQTTSERITNPVAVPDRVKPATDLTYPKDAHTMHATVSINTSALPARNPTQNTNVLKWSKIEASRSTYPKYLRFSYYNNDQSYFSRKASQWTESAKPLPSPPLSEINNPRSQQTLKEHQHLFKLVSPIKVDRFEQLLQMHPNRPFVDSVCRSLREGFWPFADTHPDTYPSIYDMAQGPPKDDAEAAFLRSQRDIEISKGRFSEAFSTQLYPSMSCSPVYGVPKPKSNDLRLVTNQSAGDYSLNSMIPYENIAGMPLDGMKHLGELLIHIRESSNRNLVLWKSDVAEAYRLIPMHILWQLKQVVTIDGQRHIDRCNCFGGRASMNCWCSVNYLVTWIAEHIRKVYLPLVYNDDSFGVNDADDLVLYEPYDILVPRNQHKLLCLWDDLGIPHRRKKQVFGSTLVIIGILVDPNAMTMTLDPEAKNELITEMRHFASSSKNKSRWFTRRAWQRLAGWINWSLNVFPLLAPSLSNIYSKIASSPDVPTAKIWANSAIKRDIMWAVEHMENSDGIRLLESLAWDEADADFVLESDACLEGMGFWYPESRNAYYCPVPDNIPSHLIFYIEALAVTSAFLHATRNAFRPLKIIIFTDNSNTVNIFNSLHASPLYNPLLKIVVDTMIGGNHKLKVRFIPGDTNTVADHIFRHRFADATKLFPSLRIQPFLPPLEMLGEPLI